MNVRNPRFTYGRIRSAICSGVPFQKVSSSATSAIGVRLWAIAAAQTRSASALVSRIVTLRPNVNSISAMSRPTASQWPRSTSILWVIFSSEPMPFHMSA